MPYLTSSGEAIRKYSTNTIPRDNNIVIQKEPRFRNFLARNEKYIASKAIMVFGKKYSISVFEFAAPNAIANDNALKNAEFKIVIANNAKNQLKVVFVFISPLYNKTNGTCKPCFLLQ